MTDPSQDEIDAALALDLLAGLLESGQGLVNGLALLSEHLPGASAVAPVASQLRLGASWDEAWSGTEDVPGLDELRRELHFAHTTGAPTAALLRATAASLRRSRKRRAEQAAAELGVRLVLPLGLCQLPAFLCLGIVPLVLTLLP